MRPEECVLVVRGRSHRVRLLSEVHRTVGDGQTRVWYAAELVGRAPDDDVLQWMREAREAYDSGAFAVADQLESRLLSMIELEPAPAGPRMRLISMLLAPGDALEICVEPVVDG